MAYKKGKPCTSKAKSKPKAKAKVGYKRKK